MTTHTANGGNGGGGGEGGKANYNGGSFSHQDGSTGNTGNTNRGTINYTFDYNVIEQYGNPFANKNGAIQIIWLWDQI